MKVLCSHCDRLSELEQFAFEGSSTLVVTCTKCGVESKATRAGVAATAATQGPVPVVPQPYRSSATPIPSASPSRFSSSPTASNVVLLKNPSTAAVERAAASAQQDPFEVPPGVCPKCLSARSPSAASCNQCGLVFARLDARALEPPAWLVTSWRTLLASWGDEGLHDRVRTQAMQADALAALGRLYRLRLVHMPDDPFALRGRDEVVRVASVPVNARLSESGEGEPKNKTKLFLMVGVLFFCIVIAVFAFRMLVASRGQP